MPVSALSLYFRLLGHYLQPLRSRFLLLALCLFGGNILQVLVPQVARNAIDLATTSDGAGQDPTGAQLTSLALAFIALAIVQQLLSLAATYFGERVAWAATNTLREDLLHHVLRLDMGFFQETSPGKLIERVDGDISALTEFFSQFFIRIVGSLLLAVVILLAIFLEDYRAGFAYLVFAIASLAILYRMRGIGIEPSKQVREVYAQLSGFIEERLAAVEDLRANGATRHVFDRMSTLHQEMRRRWSRSVLFSSLFQSTSGMILTTGFAVAFISGALLYQNGALTLGGVYLLMNYVILLNKPLTDLSFQVERLQTIGASVERVVELLERRSALPLPEPEQTMSLPSGALDVTFDEVVFGYQLDQPVLHEVSFRLPAGETLGVVGRTGSGKSTLARLLFRLYDPRQGHVALGGVPLLYANLDEVRQRVAMVTQEVQLFEGTVRENLTFFDPTVADDEIVRALHSLELGTWLAELSEGLDTRIGGGDQGLSAGQAQLLAFARAMLRRPDVVILDEASSRLDPLTETRIDRAVERLLSGRTGIVIAHRLATLNRVDHILLLEQGRIVEFGRREALAADPQSGFSRMLRMGEGLLA